MGGHIMAPFVEGPTRQSLPVMAFPHLPPQMSVGGPSIYLAVSTLLSLLLSLAGVVHVLLLT
jgi:hypothetical protein